MAPIHTIQVRGVLNMAFIHTVQIRGVLNMASIHTVLNVARILVVKGGSK